MLKFAHLSDTHIGYRDYEARNAAGHNQREADLRSAFKQAVDDIVAWDPPLVVHAGDVFDRPQVPARLQLFVQAMLRRLASVRPDGSRRQVVVVAGNHELPYSRKEACLLDLYGHLPGVRIASAGYERVRFDADADDCDPVLEHVQVHALPHDALKTVEWDEVRPVEGAVNILSSHGVAGGSDLFRRTLGREFAIPTDVLNRDWDYGALGHWHKQVEVRPRIWYCGSPEHVSFRDLRDNTANRGYLRVGLAGDGTAPDVVPVSVRIRRMFWLATIDASALTAEQISEALRANLAGADIADAVVGQRVEGARRDIMSLVDRAAILRRDAAPALHYELAVRYATPHDGDVQQRVGAADADALLTELAGDLPDERRDDAVALARSLLQETLASSPGRVDTLRSDVEKGGA